ncbi:TetR/AcrR family transcriptional regulator [Marinobacter zhanjiangensis]|uniref:TetR family transcriptional regulator n=1 Tax=Marinobacter zhanjiangensis TaxID=578215 RepID=A0ABQ3AN93_9GAMM|nr:TetR/AcrR family transcriptional regulator [Marinobacter zhanjiangensis]GGY60381.1 TetR family transcriptional regulator [Marinobacter zhanjiangensis]
MPRVAKFDRNKALEDAVRLFWERGYSGTSMKHIEKALDMRPGSLYATFGNKDGLFREALDIYAGRMSQSMAESLEDSATIMDGIFAYLRSLTVQMTAPDSPARACLVVKTLLEVTEEQEELRALVNKRLQAVEDYLVELLETARAQGELKPGVDSRRLARLIQAQIMGLRSLAQRDIDAEHVKTLTEDIITALGAFTQPPVSH